MLTCCTTAAALLQSCDIWHHCDQNDVLNCNLAFLAAVMTCCSLTTVAAHYNKFGLDVLWQKQIITEMAMPCL